MTLRDYGLSPRLRGNHVFIESHLPPARSIPAPAGEPYPSVGFDVGSTVYPRACGGTSPTASSQVIYAGLSPRLRGNHVGDYPLAR